MRFTILLCGIFFLGIAQAQFNRRKSGRQLSNPRNLRINVPGGYLPPTPDTKMCIPTTSYVTKTSVQATVITSYTQGPSGSVLTSTTLVTSVNPTTVYETDVSTRYSSYTQVFTSTQYQVSTSTYYQTIGGIPVTRTVSSTIFVPSRIVSTAYTTIQSSSFVTRTSTAREVTTVVQPFTTTRVQQSVGTSTVSVSGRGQTITTTLVSSVVSTVQTQPPAQTFYETRSIESTVYDTTTVQPRPSSVTLTQTSTYYDQSTRTTTYRDVVTSARDIFSTIASVSTVRDTQYQTITSTSQIRDTSQVVITSTRVSTRYEPTTVYRTNVVTRTQADQPVYTTFTREDVVTETGAGGFNTVTRTSYFTQVVERTSTVTAGSEQRTVVVTKTVQEECKPTGYQYNEPSVPFSFPNH